jgi:hypothetical protein
VILLDDMLGACGKVCRSWFSTSHTIHQHVDHGRCGKGKELRDDEGDAAIGAALKIASHQNGRSFRPEEVS